MDPLLSRRELLGGAATLAVSALVEPVGGQTPRAWASEIPDGYRVISQLPEALGKKLAWTVDDGVSGAAVKHYLRVANNDGLKFTFFMNSVYSSWFSNKSQIKELLDVGKIQLGNHTHTHRNLTLASERKIRQEILGCHNRILDAFDYDARPYWRPPYGAVNQKVREVALELGYSTETMWFGTFADSSATTASAVERNAEKWIRGGRIIIAHANKGSAIEHFGIIDDLLQARGLETVTLREVFD